MSERAAGIGGTLAWENHADGGALVRLGVPFRPVAEPVPDPAAFRPVVDLAPEPVLTSVPDPAPSTAPTTAPTTA
jgi:hypothetical protein